MTAGMYWHCYHDFLLNWCDDVERRIENIKRGQYGPALVCLDFIKPVKGSLPADLIEKAKEFERASANLVFTAGEHKKGVVKSDTLAAAWGRFTRARAGYKLIVDKHKKELEALHEQECSNCCWDGRRMAVNGSPTHI